MGLALNAEEKTHDGCDRSFVPDSAAGFMRKKEFRHLFTRLIIDVMSDFSSEERPKCPSNDTLLSASLRRASVSRMKLKLAERRGISTDLDVPRQRTSPGFDPASSELPAPETRTLISISEVSEEPPPPGSGGPTHLAATCCCEWALGRSLWGGWAPTSELGTSGDV